MTCARSPRWSPPKRQTLLFSATMPPSIADLAASFLTDPLKIAVSPPGKAADKVEQHVHFVAGQNAKTEMLKKIPTTIRMAAPSSSCAPSMARKS